MVQPCPTSQTRDSRPAFWAAAYTLFVLLMGTNLATPLYYVYAVEFGLSPLVITLVFAVYVGALVPSLLIAGPLSDTIGRRRVLWPAIILATLGALAFATANSVTWLLLARILQGLAVGIAAGTLTAALSELEPHGNKRRAMLISTLASLGGLAAGPLVAGMLAQYAPAPFVLPFLLEAALLGGAAATVACFPNVRSAQKWRLRRPSIPPSMRDEFSVSGAANFMAFSVLGVFLSLVPTYIIELSSDVNLAVTGGSVALMLGCSLAAQISTHGKQPFHLQRAGVLLLSAGLFLLAIAGAKASLTLMLLASAIAGSGHGMTFLGGLTEINRLAPADRRADVLSSFYVVIYLGFGIPVIGVGLLANILGVLPSVQIFAALLLSLCILQIRSMGRRRRRLSELTS